VFGIDCIEPLVQFSERNINADDKDLIASGRIKLYTRDGWQGLPDEAPFDAIHVGAAAESVPQELISVHLTPRLGYECDALFTCVNKCLELTLCWTISSLYTFVEKDTRLVVTRISSQHNARVIIALSFLYDAPLYTTSAVVCANITPLLNS
jgi:Protein-L-isoaspartate(D-aspartate) O-methyltransferase (PCMT)